MNMFEYLKARLENSPVKHDALGTSIKIYNSDYIEWIEFKENGIIEVICPSVKAMQNLIAFYRFDFEGATYCHTDRREYFRCRTGDVVDVLSLLNIPVCSDLVKEQASFLANTFNMDYNVFSLVPKESGKVLTVFVDKDYYNGAFVQFLISIKECEIEQIPYVNLSKRVRASAFGSTITAYNLKDAIHTLEVLGVNKHAG